MLKQLKQLKQLMCHLFDHKWLTLHQYDDECSEAFCKRCHKSSYCLYNHYYFEWNEDRIFDAWERELNKPLRDFDNILKKEGLVESYIENLNYCAHLNNLYSQSLIGLQNGVGLNLGLMGVNFPFF